jgi:hypothetical protein
MKVLNQYMVTHIVTIHGLKILSCVEYMSR